MPHGGKRPGAGRPRKQFQYEAPRTHAEIEPSNDRKGFTPEDVRKLQSSPHIRKVTNKTISYTLEFKEHFWEQYNLGNPPVIIFIEAGLDTKIIGDQRIYGLLSTLRKTKERGLKFKDGDEPQPPKQGVYETTNLPRPPRLPKHQKLLIGKVEEADVMKLMHQVAFLTQEVAFIKKIIMTANGGTSK
jgi:hypothetical protein